MHQDEPVVTLDGSVGLTERALLTLYTKGEDGLEKEETFHVPYGALDQNCLKKYTDLLLILGYKVVRQAPSPVVFS